MIISRMCQNQLQREADSRQYAKWWTLCLLRLLRLPTLDACLIEADASKIEALKRLDLFANTIGRSQVLVRSDGGIEHKKYPRGGITYDVEAAFDAVTNFMKLGRAVVLLEPTNRLSNRLSINVVVDETNWIAEGLGCGFDTSDLQRDFVTPEWSWSGWWGNDNGPARVTAREVKGGVVETATHAERVEQRLESIADLYSFGICSEGTDRARSFLLQTNNTCLFSKRRPVPSRRDVAKVVADARLIALALDRRYIPFTLAYAQLDDERRIYWDVSFGRQKWAIPTVRRLPF